MNANDDELNTQYVQFLQTKRKAIQDL